MPLLEEYCYEDYGTLAKILGKGLVDESGQRIRERLFEAGRKDDLIQALKAIDPTIDTSHVAVSSEGQAGEAQDEEDSAEDGDASS